MVLSRVRLIRVKLVLVNLNPINDTYIPIVPQNAATTPAKNRLKQQSAWQTPSNCRHFHDILYQIQFSDCSALPESRLQSLPHPYSPLKTHAVFRINRNPVPDLEVGLVLNLKVPEQSIFELMNICTCSAKSCTQKICIQILYHEYSSKLT